MSTTNGRKFPAQILSNCEVEALLKAVSRRCPTGRRNRAMIALIYRTGLRIRETLALFVEDVNLDAGTVRVLIGKGKEDRTVGIDSGAAAYIDAWMPGWTAVSDRFETRTPLFCTRNGKRVLPSYVRDLLPRLALRAGINKRVHAHGLRHTHAAQLAAEGQPVNLIQQQLGHRNIATTNRYLEHIHPAELIKRMRARTWGHSGGP